MALELRKRVLLCLLALTVFPTNFPRSEEIAGGGLRGPWKASWIAFPESPRREFGVYHFRKTFTLASPPESFVIDASADNRYELFVNSERVLTGPARGDLYHWRYETRDIAPRLRAGKNVLAALVWNFAEQAPMAQMTHETALIVHGHSDRESVANTDASWKAFRNPSVEMIPLDPKKLHDAYTVVGPGEHVDGTRYPWGWADANYDDSSWRPAVVLTPGGPRGIQDSPSRWMLVPRTIPLMEAKLERLPRVVRTSGVTVPAGFLEGNAPVTIPPETRASLLFDQTHLTTAYPELVAAAGAGARLTVTYAEALWREGKKGNRNETEGKEIAGYQDQFLPDGGDHRLFRPLWWRTFRYLQIDVETRAQPLVLEDLRAVFSAYPFADDARFESDDARLARIWEVGWRTARLCAHETYVDCPYYEQLQYVGDTRIQALISLYVAADDRLVKNAIEQIDDSRTPEGLTQSRFPSFLPQYIPPFSLLWIGMMHDLWWYRGETDFLKQFLPGTRGVLGWFEVRLTASGLLGRLEWWDFVDWTKDFEDGVPPEEARGQSAILSMQFAAALREAAELESSFGSEDRAGHDRTLAARIVTAVRRSCWDAARGLIADTPARRHFSQHANILAVLTDAVPADEQKRVMGKVLSDPALTQCSYYFRFYLFRAMKKAGFGDEYLKQLEPWRQMLALGLTTWAETPEPTRSDCHAWSAHPNFDLLATVAGIEPAAAGFREVAIRPHLGPLRHLTASLTHPLGRIEVKYTRDGPKLVAEISLPRRLSGWFYWRATKVALHGGRQELRF